MNYEDMMALEGEAEDMKEYYSAMQRAINGGAAWKFQGSYGRAMMEAITEGFCMLGREVAFDYWGNRIPSRDEVKEGAKGSYGYVAARQGDAWAREMAEE